MNVHGDPIQFSMKSGNLESDIIDFRGFNCAIWWVWVNGATSGATVKIVGGAYKGGRMTDLPDHRTRLTTVTTDQCQYCWVSAPFARIKLEDYVDGEFTVVLVPYSSGWGAP